MNAYIESDAKVTATPENAVRSSPVIESGHLATVEKAGDANRSQIAPHASRPRRQYDDRDLCPYPASEKRTRC
jgi:hypothetical protein